MFRFAHISDIHLPLTPARPSELVNKRFLGYLSWQRERKKHHLPEALAALVHDMNQFEPDHICITGDLVNIALPSEFVQAEQWLKDLAPTAKISFIPGNHDVYVRQGGVLMADKLQRWLGPDYPASFPMVQKRGPYAFVGLTSAVPTGPLMASGRLGQRQLVALERVLGELKRENLKRVVLLHHPPQQGAEPWRKALHDAEDFRQVIANAGADLILHGHKHKPLRASLRGPDGLSVPVFGAGSASHKNSAHYHVFDLSSDGWQVLHRRCNKETRQFETVAQEQASYGVTS